MNIRKLLTRCALVAVALVALLVGGAGSAQQTIQAGITISHPWVQETAVSDAVLHVTIANTGARADHLLRASTSIANKVSIVNQLSHEGGGLLISGRSEMVLGAGAPRIELVGLKKPLKAPDAFDLLLVFRQAGKVYIVVKVERE
jgi:copper(I)-binding protein